MARTVTEIFDSMVAEGRNLATQQGNADVLDMFNNTSKVAVWRILFFVKAFAVMVLEQVMDARIAALDTKIEMLQPPTPSWHKGKIKAFQFGFNLIPDTDVFDNTGATDADIEASKIIKYAAVTETVVDNERVILYKIAKLNGTDLVPLTDVELAAFKAYMKSYRPGGVAIVVYNQAADLLRTVVEVYYNPLLIDVTGLRTDGAGYPVKEAAINYPLTLEFDGEFINAGFIDALQASYGVSRRKVNLVKMERKTGAEDWQSVGSSFVPMAGYCKFDVNTLTINYIADV